MFSFYENFQSYDENYKPYGIFIQSSSWLWHKHAICNKNGFTVSCTGNKYFLETPKLSEFDLTYKFKFEVLNDYGAISVILGYNCATFCGKELRVEWRKSQSDLTFKLVDVVEEKVFNEERELNVNGVDFATANEEYVIKVSYRDTNLTAEVENVGKVCFKNVTLNKGVVGFARPHFIGGVTFTYVEASWNASVKLVNNPVKVEIPLENGGTMPLNVEYTLFTADEKPYLTAKLDGGPQYRTEENYNPYPRNKNQYCVERWFMDTPYITYNGKKYVMKVGEFNTVDPLLAWREILKVLVNYSSMPLTVTFPIDSVTPTAYGFGYDNLEVVNFSTQVGANEFKFSPSGEYLGYVIPKDTFELLSPKDKKAVKIIPTTVFDYQTVKRHFELNHYFAENEDISFTIFSYTDKKYITFKAELQTVYGEKIADLTIIDNKITYPPMEIGVYRVCLYVYYGDALYTTVDTVFEVFDETGKRCAPIESGLPFMFSSPSEQQYLDRDIFDPWNTKRSCNSEHFYACVAFTGHVAEYKRIWEVTKLFGRKWYVWLSNTRSMVDHDIQNHIEIVKNADFIYYPSEYEWGNLRSDFFLPHCWKRMRQRSKTYELLNEFLDLNNEAREKVGLVNGNDVTRSVIINLYKYYKKQWYEFASKRITKAFEKQNELFNKLNSNLKRSAYGPFNVYVSTMRTSKLCEDYGFERGDTLSDVIYTGFCQFEDYPTSCAYQTYRGAFGAGATLVDSPKLKIYPEQYKNSRGGTIDGAVFFAYPPVAKLDYPIWFNVTHAREYVYNTARKTENGYAYWDTYGFHKYAHYPDVDDYFVRDWVNVINHKPIRPLKSAIFVCEFNSSDDGFDGDYPGWLTPYNVSEEGVGYVYESARLSGLPNGAFTNWKGLLTVNSSDVDLLVIPSTEGAPKEVINKIKELYNQGVSLIAVSRVDGLEDLFGVEYAAKKVKFNSISIDSELESVYPYEEEARYNPTSANILLKAGETPAILTRERTALLNISPCALGRVYFYNYDQNARVSNSELLRKVCNNVVKELSTPIAYSNNAGITLFQDEHKNTVLLAIDYSRHDQTEIYSERVSVINFEKELFKNAESIDGKPLRKFFNTSGTLDGIEVTLRQHESALIKLIK